VYEEDEIKKNTQEIIDRKGYRLKAPCQDILGFLCKYAPTSTSEKYILDYMYFVSKHHKFVIKTQIMNEGWAMYWEKKIMHELFKDGIVGDVIDYCRVFSGVCRPRPFFMRNPYHLGFHMWTHIEELYRKGKISLNYIEEKDRNKKENWDNGGDIDPIKSMEHLVKTITDYEFIRRFLDNELIEKLYLNKISIEMASNYGFFNSDEWVIRRDDKEVWLNPDMVKKEMLNFFSDFGKPTIYIVNTDFRDGGLLLYHRHKGRDLKCEWIGPTLRNINYIWKAPVYIISENSLYGYSNGKVQVAEIDSTAFTFETIKDCLYEKKSFSPEGHFNV